MYCRTCGNEILDDTLFCPKCGAKQQESGTPATPQPIIVNVHNENNNANVGGIDANYPYKSKWTAFLLCFFLGGIGVHRFYVGKTGTGILWLLTAGVFGVGWLVDWIVILCGGFRDKAGYPLK